MVAYDITRDGIANGLWFFALWALFATAMFAFSVKNVKTAVFPDRSYFVLAISTLFITVVIVTLVTGFSRRQACLNSVRAGNFDVTEGVVSQLERFGRSAPFTYSFVLGNKKFVFERALFGSCGIAERPNFQLRLTEGSRLRIEHSDDEIYRVLLQTDL